MADAQIPEGPSLSPRAEAEPPPAVESMATDAMPMPVLVQCQICLEVVADHGDWTVALTACGHCFCIVCITAFLNVQITDGCVDLVCFHDDNQICQTEILVEDIQRLVTPTMFAKYERFRLLRKNPQARQCPHCSFVHVTTGSKDEPICVCTACEKRFCFLHADAHAADVSCKQFEKRQSKRERRSGRVVKRISRPCPQCAQPIQKNGGCVHMTCAVCKAEFCWWCGETWGFNYERHYNQLLDAECCNGIAYEQVPGLNSPHTALRWLARFWYYFSIVAVGIPTTTVLIVVYAWIWAPAAWRGQNKIHPRSLVRFIAIRFLQVMLFVAYIVAIVIAFIVIVLADGLGWLTRKLRALAPIVRPRLQRCCPRPRTREAEKDAAESEPDSPAFVVIEDLERGQVEEEL